VETGTLLRRLQEGEALGLPHSRPMSDIGGRCHELRIQDENRTWRLVYCIRMETIVVLDVFPKTIQKTPKRVINDCKRRLKQYIQALRTAE
jgi:phage-related protein